MAFRKFVTLAALLTMRQPFNIPALRGHQATPKATFGGANDADGSPSRYCVYAVHTTFDAVMWFVDDAEQIDEITERPLVIRQGASCAEVIQGLA